MNTACREALLHLKNRKFTHGLTLNLKHAQNHAAAVINQEMLLALNREHLKRSTRVYAMHHKSQPSGKSVVLWIVRLSGSKVNGVNVLHLADKMAHEREKFIARKSVQMGKF